MGTSRLRGLCGAGGAVVVHPYTPRDPIRPPLARCSSPITAQTSFRARGWLRVIGVRGGCSVQPRSQHMAWHFGEPLGSSCLSPPPPGAPWTGPRGKHPQFHPFWGCPGHEGCRWPVQEEPQGTQAPLAPCLVLDADLMPGYPSAAPQRGRSMNIHLLGETASTHTRLSDSCQSPSPGRDAGAPGVPAGKDAPGEAAPGLCGCRMTAAGWEALGSGLLWGLGLGSGPLWGWALGYGGSFGAGHWDWGRFGTGCPTASCFAPKDPACPTSGAPCG